MVHQNTHVNYCSDFFPQRYFKKHTLRPGNFSLLINHTSSQVKVAFLVLAKMNVHIVQVVTLLKVIFSGTTKLAPSKMIKTNIIEVIFSQA